MAELEYIVRRYHMGLLSLNEAKKCCNEVLREEKKHISQNEYRKLVAFICEKL